MNIKKLAITLAALVIVGLLIFATIKYIIPSAFDYINCAFKAFLNPSGTSSSLASCAEKINFRLGD